MAVDTYLLVFRLVSNNFGSIFMSILDSYFPNIDQTLISWIPLTIYNLACIGKIVKDSQSPEGGISGRIFNAKNLQTLGVTIRHLRKQSKPLCS